MKNLPLLCILMLSACSPRLYTQVFNVKPASQLKDLDNSYVFESDTVRIVYDFWAEHGCLSITISNKLKIPLYINWKESSYIRNDEKLNYWQDETTTTASTSTSGYYYNGYYTGNSQTTSNQVKPQKTEFIPPGSYINLREFILLPSGITPEKDKVTYSEVSRTDKPKRQTTIFTRSYLPDESMLRFRNYLTFSTSENFETEIHTDNSFYLGKITTMDTRQFKGLCKEDKCLYPFTDPRSFYINLNTGESQLIHSGYLRKH